MLVFALFVAVALGQILGVAFGHILAVAFGNNFGVAFGYIFAVGNLKSEIWNVNSEFLILKSEI